MKQDKITRPARNSKSFVSCECGTSPHTGASRDAFSRREYLQETTLSSSQGASWKRSTSSELQTVFFPVGLRCAPSRPSRENRDREHQPPNKRNRAPRRRESIDTLTPAPDDDCVIAAYMASSTRCLDFEQANI